MLDFCKICGNKIMVAIFKGTGICSENCKKADERISQNG